MSKTGIIIVTIVATVLIVVSGKPHHDEVLKKIKKINSMQSSWKAGITEFSYKSDSEMRGYLGALKPRKNLERKHIKVAANLPSEFDSRQQWPNCPSISLIKDQGHCESCWAVSTAAAASDRLCIATNGDVQRNLSANNLMGCCSNCAPDGWCTGGWPIDAWTYIENTGTVTGSDYDSNQGCQPYEVPPTGSVAPNKQHNGQCETYCTNSDYDTDYNDDFHYGSSAYNLNNDVGQIQTDVLNNGPNVACFDVYGDFQDYQSGVYQKQSNKYLGSHAVKVLGWGTEDGLDYWLIANSWNTGWGEHGTFKILRGANECGIETTVSGGLIST